jgi:hypothetical protein
MAECKNHLKQLALGCLQLEQAHGYLPSGGGFVDDDGTVYLSYWMLWGPRGIGLAKSSDPDFDHWTKLPANPVRLSAGVLTPQVAPASEFSSSAMAARQYCGQ